MTEDKELFSGIDLDELKKTRKLNKVVYVRTDSESYHWLIKKGINPTKLFNMALQSIIKKDGK